MKRSKTSTSVIASLFLVATAFVQACEGDDPLIPGTMAIEFEPTSGSAAQGGTVTIPVTVEANGSFSGTPSVTVTDLPAGVTATVGNIVRTGSTSTTTVTLNVAQTAVAGIYPVTVVATGQGVSAVGSPFMLTITGGTLGLALTPATLSVAQGANATSTVAITRTGFTGDVGLTVTGAPTGVTATLDPTTATGNTSTLTVTAAPNATLGAATLTLTGTSPIAGNRTVTLPITVTAPASSIGLTLAPTALTIARSANARSTITLARTNFTGEVTFTAENLPAGVTASFAPNPNTTGTTTLTLTTTAAAATGTNNITIRATGTGVTAVTAPLALTITP
jgi:hypothetical protein